MKSYTAAIAKTRLQRDIAAQRNGGYWMVTRWRRPRQVNLALGPVVILQPPARCRWVYLR